VRKRSLVQGWQRDAVMTINFDGLLQALAEQDSIWLMAAAILVMALAILVLCLAAFRQQNRGGRR